MCQVMEIKLKKKFKKEFLLRIYIVYNQLEDDKRSEETLFKKIINF